MYTSKVLAAAKLLFVFFSMAISFLTSANDIAFGVLEGIKVYDYSNSKVTKIYFADDSTSQNVPGCDLEATITHSLRSEAALNQMVSIAMAAYISGKKVRAHSSTDTCELDFIAIQEERF